MTEAESAVAYLIRRLHADPDLRHHMLGTEALAKLVEAEAGFTGTAAEEILRQIRAKHQKQDQPRLVQCRKALTDIHDLAADCLDRGCSRAEETLRAIQDRTEAHRE